MPTVHRLLPDTRPGRVIITSLVRLARTLPPVEITALGTDPAARLLLTGAADTDKPAARTLADELGGLPLALQQAASYCQQNGKTLHSYLALFRDTRKQGRLLAAPGDDGDEAVATTWVVSIDKVRASNPAAAALLSVLAYVSADAIPRTLLANTDSSGREEDDGQNNANIQAASHEDAGTSGDPLAPLDDLDDLGVDEALGLLHRYSLIRADHRGDHRPRPPRSGSCTGQP